MRQFLLCLLFFSPLVSQAGEGKVLIHCKCFYGGGVQSDLAYVDIVTRPVNGDVNDEKTYIEYFAEFTGNTYKKQCKDFIRNSPVCQDPVKFIVETSILQD